MESPTSELKVSLVEVFKSVQGEGANVGRLAIFVRLAGCNLSCVFADGAICDTPYMRANLRPSMDELFRDLILPRIPPGSLTRDTRLTRPMLILTGGEPTLHPAFDELAFQGSDRGFYVAVETNGTKFRPGLHDCDWICISPKNNVSQGSPSPYHNQNPQSPALHAKVGDFAGRYPEKVEWRYVISGPDTPRPPYYPGARHYLSPAIKADGEGMEWKTGFPGFAEGAVDRCLAIIEEEPRWRLSLQTHKFLGVR